MVVNVWAVVGMVVDVGTVVDMVVDIVEWSLTLVVVIS